MSVGVVQHLRFFIEGLSENLFQKGHNPFYFLGALSLLFFWVLLGSGIYLFLFYKLNIDGAYDSVQSLTDQRYWGGVIRSLHRYAADGLMISMVLHALRTFLADQYRYARWVAWVTGMVILGFIWAEGILGYWMVWDSRSQFIALKTAEFLDVLPILGGSLPRAFLTRDLVTNLFFLVIIALHAALPILMLAMQWLHVSRISRPVINPPYDILLAALSALLILSLVYPATSAPRADPAQLPIGIPIDWFYLALYPAFNTLPAVVTWVLLAGCALFLSAAPWIGSSRRPEPVSLVLKRCNECARCYEDCPYEAITMRPRTDERPYSREAFIHPDLCVSCGICLGSCSTAALVLPDINMISILTEIRKRRSADRAVQDKTFILEFLCEKAMPDKQIKEVKSRLNPIGIPCLGAIHPTVIEQSLRAGVTGILLAGCAEGDCHYRLGNRWLQDRLFRRREPSLKETLDLSKVRMISFPPSQAAKAITEMENFQNGVKTERPFPLGFQAQDWIKKLAAGLIIFIPALLIFFFSNRPTYSFYNKDDSLLVLSLKYTASPRKCRELSREELERLPEQMRTPVVCSRERWPILVRLEVDGETRLEKTYRPTGFSSDGPAFVYEKFKLKPGAHDTRLILQEAPAAKSVTQFNRIDVGPGKRVVLNLAPTQ